MNDTWQISTLAPPPAAPDDLELWQWKSNREERSLHYPSVALYQGEPWILALAYDTATQAEQLWLHSMNSAADPLLLHAIESSILSPTLVSTNGGALYIFWIEGPQFALWAARYDPDSRRLIDRREVSQPGARCMHLTSCRDRDGLWLAWESWQEDASCAVHTRHYSAGSGWSPLQTLTPPRGRAYWPTLAAAGDRLWLAWCTPNASLDGYDLYGAVYPRGGSHHEEARIFLLNEGMPGNFHLYPALQATENDEIWVAWMANTDLEYYDLIQWPGNSDFAYVQNDASRRKRNVWWKLANTFVLQLSENDDRLLRRRPPGTGEWGRNAEAGHCHYPALVPQGSGVPLLLGRRITPNYLFETVRSACVADAWQTPQTLQPSLLQVARNSPISLAWEPQSATLTMVQQAVQAVDGERYIGARPSDQSAVLLLRWREEPIAGEPPLLASLPPLESAAWQVASAPLPPRAAHKSLRGDKIYFGNIHVHSDLSGCRRDTQQTVDFNYRWARDLMQQDFHALTDHAEHMVPYDWKWTRAMHAFYQFPGHFVAILAYEWTLNKFEDRAHSGHCNVLLREPVPRALGSDDDRSGSLPDLWAQLPPRQAMTIPHHTATYPFLRDFTMHDPQFERLVEVQQDRRGNYEYPGCPGEYGTVVPFQASEHNVPGGYVNDALQRGLQIGLCAGGDHMGISMSGVYAERLHPDAIFDALYSRRCYGVTGAEIVLDFNACTGAEAQNSVCMGGSLPCDPSARITLRVRAIGASPLDRVDLIVAGEALQTVVAENEAREIEAVFQAPSAAPAYYYARVMQNDGQMAWSSPIWIVSR